MLWGAQPGRAAAVREGSAGVQIPPGHGSTNPWADELSQVPLALLGSSGLLELPHNQE